MAMHFAPDPSCIRGSGLSCDVCRKYIPNNWEEGYFICGASCDYDICRDCGMKAGGVDPDEEIRRNFQNRLGLLSKKAVS